MQTEDNARIARLEQLLDERQQLLDELQRENAQLKEDLDGLRFAIRAVIGDTVDTFAAIERQTEIGKQRLEKTLGRPVTKTSKLIDELARHKVTP